MPRHKKKRRSKAVSEDLPRLGNCHERPTKGRCKKRFRRRAIPSECIGCPQRPAGYSMDMLIGRQ